MLIFEVAYVAGRTLKSVDSNSIVEVLLCYTLKFETSSLSSLGLNLN